MSDFDPYLKWLGIRDPQRPPNHYRLLGLELFESDPEVINAAADRQMVHVRSFQIGPHGEASQELLNQLAEARRCLLNDAKRAEYDAALNPTTSPPPTATPLPTAAPPIAATAPAPTIEEPPIRTSVRKPSKSKGASGATRSIVLALSIISGGVAAVIVGYFLIQTGTVPVASDVNPITGEKINKPVEPSQPKPEATPTIEAPEATPPEPPPKKADPIVTKPEIVQPDPPKQADPERRRSRDAKAPWETSRQPPLPGGIRSPKTELDRLLRDTRIAVGLRDFTEAQSEWLKVKSKVNKITREIELTEELRNQRDFWRQVAEAAAKMQPGTKLEMGTKEVIVERVLDDGLLLTYDGKKSKFFDIERESLDRDLAYAIVTISPQLHDYPVSKFLAVDFVHLRDDLEKLKANPAQGFAGMDPAIPPAGPEPVKVPFKTGNNVKDPVTILSPKKRAAIPKDSEMTEARKTVRNFYKEGYEKQRPANQRVEIAQQMILAAIEEQDDPATRYALLSESAEICKSCGEAKAGIQALESLNRFFDIDFWNEAKDFMVATAKKVNSSRQLEEAADGFRDLSIRALKVGKYEVAYYLANKGATVAQKIGDLAIYNNAVLLKNETKEIDRIFSRASKAENTIVEDPDNAKANEDLGTFYCLVKGDFEKGLRHWSKSNKSAYEQIAEMEITFDESQAKDKELTIADAWFELGEDKKTYIDARCLARAKYWYDLARPKTTGLYLRKVTSKITEIDTLMEKLPSVLNENLTFDESRFFDVEWQFGVYFTAEFRSYGSVQIRTQRPNRPGSYTSNTLSWEKVGTEYHVANEDDNTTIVFRPRISGQTISFEKIHNQTREVLLRGVGVPKP